MHKRKPEGYKNLLAYKKALELQVFTNQFVAHFPKSKTMIDLADQMSRSGRSGSKNIVEGWKRNTTQEYFQFLGYSIGAVEELKDDAADIAKGSYGQLFNHAAVMKGGWLSQEALDALKFYPLQKNLPGAVELYLRAKEVNFLLYKLQQSLDLKMDHEKSKPIAQRVRENWSQEKNADQEFKSYMESLGMVRQEDGRFVDLNEKGEKGNNG